MEVLEELIQDDELSVIYFSAPNCSVCEAVYPRICNIAEDYGVKILKINIKEYIKLSSQLLIFSVPTIIVVKDKKEILRESRFIDFNNIDHYCSINK